MKKKIVIFASGAGSNANNIINYFRNSNIEVALIVCNKPDAGVLSVASENNINICLFHKHHNSWRETLEQINQVNPDLIVLAGYLLKIPKDIIDLYTIINIHPALLPNYGGKGMYGYSVHKAVIEAGEKYSGITIHYIDEHYDNGSIIVQAYCNVNAGEDPIYLSQRIHNLEHFYLPRTIEFLIS